MVGKNFASCQLGDERLDNRAFSIGKALNQGFGKALSEIFKGAKELKEPMNFCQREDRLWQDNQAALSDDHRRCRAISSYLIHRGYNLSG
jgi:hypothetical protein